MQVKSPLALIPTDRLNRWAVLRDVVAQWYPPICASDGFHRDEIDAAESRLGISLPAAIREWHALAGRRSDIWSGQDHFLPPDDWRLNGDYLVLLIENQDVVQWGVRVNDLGLDDPPVYSSSVDDSTVWLKSNDSVSAFALQMFAYCLKWSKNCRWWANAYVELDILERAISHYPCLPFAESRWPALTRFYGFRDIVAEVQAERGDRHAWLYIVTRTTTATESFKDTIGSLNIEWNSSSDEWPPGWVSASQDLD